ncbi:MAG TPA: DUF1194 domain-containing protein [Hyphomicrobiaceae bacterium]|nr:DUF1194 domain-containing protein [Hyphomicrobiaceae bacterium]
MNDLLRLGLAALALALPCFPQASVALEEVDLELVLLADSSGSIDAEELQLQREGYAAAFQHPQVLGAIGRGARGRIAVTYVEWADAAHQSVLVPWMVIDGAQSAARFAEALKGHPRLAWGSNAIGAAIAKAQQLIEGNAFEGDRKVIDFSGDSANNWHGISIAAARAAALSAGMVINGLAITCRERGCSGRPRYYDLEDAFARTIIGGPGSFVLTADGKTSFEEAVRRKLVLEIAALPGNK